jgi:hypothetical protein
VTEPTTVAEPLVVEEAEAKRGYAGQNVPRKEDKSAPSTSRRRWSIPECSAR